MNAALTLLNALAVVCLLGFQYQTGNSDPAEVHIKTDNWVQRPVAQRAAMHESQAKLALMANEDAGKDVMEARQTVATDRYIF